MLRDKIIYVFAFIFIFSMKFAYSHGGAMGPPIDVTNSAGNKVHGGFGTFGVDDYIAAEKLQKRCLKQDLVKSLKKLGCYEDNLDPSSELSIFASDQAKLTNTLYFQDYFSKVLFNEINPDSYPGKIKIGNCPEVGVESQGEAFPHMDVRQSSKRLKNALSATILYEINDSYKAKAHYYKGSQNYQKRLETNYSFLFLPIGNYQKLLNLVEEYTGDDFNTNISDQYAHLDTMSTVEAAMDSDQKFKEDLGKQLSLMLAKYRAELKKQTKDLCPFDFKKMQKRFPAIFQQAIIDMSDKSRAISDLHLCNEEFYYNPKKFDSDCDGVDDVDDDSPSDPYSPKNEWSFNYRDKADPPFGSDTKYKTSTQNNKITLEKTVVLSYSKMSESTRNKLNSRMNKCIDELKTDFEKTFEKSKSHKKGFEGKELEINIKLADFNDNEEYDRSDVNFYMHKCYCSGCVYKVKKYKTISEATFFEKIYNFGEYLVTDEVSDFYDESYVPRDTCAEDLTKDQVLNITTDDMSSAAKSRFVRYQNEVEAGSSVLDAAKDNLWFSQANAKNLSIRGLEKRGENCHVIKHEILHQMGLPDEYLAEYYPFNRVGSHESVMRSGNELKARHLWSILSPKECSVKVGNVQN